MARLGTNDTLDRTRIAHADRIPLGIDTGTPADASFLTLRNQVLAHGDDPLIIGGFSDLTATPTDEQLDTAIATLERAENTSDQAATDRSARWSFTTASSETHRLLILVKRVGGHETTAISGVYYIPPVGQPIEEPWGSNMTRIREGYLVGFSSYDVFIAGSTLGHAGHATFHLEFNYTQAQLAVDSGGGINITETELTPSHTPNNLNLINSQRFYASGFSGITADAYDILFINYGAESTGAIRDGDWHRVIVADLLALNASSVNASVNNGNALYIADQPEVSSHSYIGHDGAGNLLVAANGQNKSYIGLRARAQKFAAVSGGGGQQTDTTPAAGSGSGRAHLAFLPDDSTDIAAGALYTRASGNGHSNAFPAGEVVSLPAQSQFSVDVPSPTIAGNVATFGADSAITGRRIANIPIPEAEGDSCLLALKFELPSQNGNHQFWGGARGWSVDYAASTGIISISLDSTTSAVINVVQSIRPANNTLTNFLLWIVKTAAGYDFHIIFNGVYFSRNIATATIIPDQMSFGCEWLTDFANARRRLVADVQDVLILNTSERTVNQAYCEAHEALTNIENRGDLYDGLASVDFNDVSQIGWTPDLLPSPVILAHTGEQYPILDLDEAHWIDTSLYSFLKMFVGISGNAGRVDAILELASSRLHIINHTGTINDTNFALWRAQNVLEGIGRTSSGAPFIWHGDPHYGGVTHNAYIGFFGDGTPNTIKRIVSFRHPTISVALQAAWGNRHIWEIRGERIPR